MKPVTAEQMRELDRRTIEEAGIPGRILMQRAGRGVARAVELLARLRGGMEEPVLLAAGKGNNGGDAFAAALFLKRKGFVCEVWLAGRRADVRGDAVGYLEEVEKAGIPLKELPEEEDWVQAEESEWGVVVDGLLGTGTRGAPRGSVAAAIAAINRAGERAPVVAIDIPSGVDADSGVVSGEAVYADLTVTMALPKIGLLEQAVRDFVGSVQVVDIGIPASFIQEAGVDAAVELVSAQDLRAWFPRRRAVSHKGDYGHVLLLGGAPGYSGAICMAARAAVRSGAGLVSVVVPRGIAAIVAAAVPEAMVTGEDETESGSLSAGIWERWRNRLDRYSAVLAGPGMTRHQQTLVLLRNFLRECPCPMVFDADAISVFEGQPHWFERARAPLILTPHPGELARLLVMSVAEIQSDRRKSAEHAAEVSEGIVVLKGSGTIISAQGRPSRVNLSGNPGMATGGCGDVLAGLMVGLLGQGVPAYEAASAAVFFHGWAGDFAAWRKSQRGMTALDLVEELPAAYRLVSTR